MVRRQAQRQPVSAQKEIAGTGPQGRAFPEQAGLGAVTGKLCVY